MLFNTNIAQCLDPIRNLIVHYQRWTVPNLGTWKSQIYALMLYIIFFKLWPGPPPDCPLAAEGAHSKGLSSSVPCPGAASSWEDLKGWLGGAGSQTGCPSCVQALLQAGAQLDGLSNFRTMITSDGQVKFRLGLIIGSFKSLNNGIWVNEGVLSGRRNVWKVMFWTQAGESFLAIWDSWPVLGHSACSAVRYILPQPAGLLSAPRPTAKIHSALALILLLCDQYW